MSAILPSSGDEPGFGPAFPTVYNLVYCSRAATGVDDAELQRIVATARRRNAQLGITGLLVFGSGIFFQWLEGPREQVTALMARLHADARHQNIVELSAEEDVDGRLFPDWAMELVSSDHIREVLTDALGSAGTPAQARGLERLLAHLDSAELDGLEGAAPTP
jgi:Sensors of blue-light using FAD